MVGAAIVSRSKLVRSVEGLANSWISEFFRSKRVYLIDSYVECVQRFTLRPLCQERVDKLDHNLSAFFLILYHNPVANSLQADDAEGGNKLFAGLQDFWVARRIASCVHEQRRNGEGDIRG